MSKIEQKIKKLKATKPSDMIHAGCVMSAVGFDEFEQAISVIDTLTSELEAERKAKEEAIRLLKKVFLGFNTEDDNLSDFIEETTMEDIQDFITTHSVSKGEK